MSIKYPRYIETVAGGRHFIEKVWYEMGRGVYRVSWRVGDTPKGCLAVVSGEDFREYVHPAPRPLAPMNCPTLTGETR